MESLLVVLLTLGIFLSAASEDLGRDIKYKVYDVCEECTMHKHMKVLIDDFVQQVDRNGFTFQEKSLDKDGSFSLYNKEPFILVLKPSRYPVLHAFFIAGFDKHPEYYEESTHRHLYQLLNANDYLALSPIAVKEAAKSYFNLPVTYLFNRYNWGAFRGDGRITVVFLVPKEDVDKEILKSRLGEVAEIHLNRDNTDHLEWKSDQEPISARWKVYEWKPLGGGLETSDSPVPRSNTTSYPSEDAVDSKNDRY